MTSKPDSMTSDPNLKRASSNDEVSLLMDHDMDEDFDIDTEEPVGPNVPVLSLQDLMSPRPNGDRLSLSPIPLECRDSVDTLLVSNLLPQFQDITVENNDGQRSGGVSMRASSRFAMDL